VDDRRANVDDVVVQTTAGLLRGLRSHGVCRFAGVPFAAPPVGGRRFLPPVGVGCWRGTHDATRFGPVAMQIPSVLELERGLPSEMSEDCLTLNLWTPDVARRSGELLPVLVWVHGGSFLNGSGSMPWFDGTALGTRGDVVVVSINYRLGVFGYLDLSAVAGEAYAEGGNAGLLDQVAALSWIRDNIESFGGDPGRVCVVGESAGAMSIGTLLGTPLAEGLFQRAILQSGTPVGQPRVQAEEIAAALLEDLRLQPNGPGVSALIDLDAGTILDAAARITTRAMQAAQTGKRSSFPWSPVVDGVVLPDHPLETITSGASSRVPVLIGTTADEMRILRRLWPDRPPITQSQIEEHLADLFGDRAEEAEAAYKDLHPDASLDDLWDALASDRIFNIPTAEFIDRRVAAGGETWTYLFNWRSPAEDGRYGAAHTVEIPFVFNTFDAPGAPEFVGRPGPATRILAQYVQDAWVGFARDGVPSAAGLPGWPACAGQARPTMVFDEECRVVDDPFGPARAIWHLTAAAAR
jgi:para-nitrobenzyl esterase